MGKQAGRQTLLARDLKTQQQVVVKLLSFSSDFNWEDLKLFQREVETLKSLSHPAIPQYLDSFEIDTPNRKGFALVQTYIAAKSLQEYLSDGRTFSENEVKKLATALLDILAYLHQRQPPVIHRDIKPSNILLHSRSGHSVGQVYLVDFGSVQNQAAMFLCALFRKLRLRINRQQISYRFHLLGLKWNHSKPVPRQDIWQLEIAEIEDNVSDVIIQTGNQEYRLGKKQGLSKSEIEWLASELSQWLGLKIQRTLTDGKKNISM